MLFSLSHVTKHVLESKSIYYSMGTIYKILHWSQEKNLTHVVRDICQRDRNSDNFLEVKGSSLFQTLIKPCNQSCFTSSSRVNNDREPLDNETFATGILVKNNSYELHLCVIFWLSYRKCLLDPLQEKMYKKSRLLVSTMCCDAIHQKFVVTYYPIFKS